MKIIGLGNVGVKLAGSLLRNGFDLTVRDIDQAAAAPLQQSGASWGESGRQVAQGSDVIVTCLPSPEVSAQVLEEPDGVLAGISEGKIWLEASTTSVDEVKRLGALVAAKGGLALGYAGFRRLPPGGYRQHFGLCRRRAWRLRASAARC